MQSTHYAELLESVGDARRIDAHSHIIPNARAAQGLHDILLYHMSVSELYAAGCPDGARLTAFPAFPDRKEREERVERAVAYLDQVRFTSTNNGIRMILEDLYEWREPITTDNWRHLDRLIAERAEDESWHRQVIDKARITRICTEALRRKDGYHDELFFYSLEWGFFTRTERGYYDSPLYELERLWGSSPEPPRPVTGGARAETHHRISSLSDVQEAVTWYCTELVKTGATATATHFSTDVELREVSDDEMTRAIALRDSARAVERDIYASYITELLLERMEAAGGDVIFQFSCGAEPLPFETSSRLSQDSIGRIGELIARHPGIRFMCFLGSAHANQAMCTLARELPNLTLAGYWWHAFFPSFIRRIIDERLDMLPLNRNIGFFSDAYCIEWAYAKSRIVSQALAEVLSAHIERGRISRSDSEEITRAILYETPHEAYGIAE